MASILKRLRKQLGFGREEVASALCWSINRLDEVEQCPDPDAEDVHRLSVTYGVDLEAVITSGNTDLASSPVAALLKAGSTTLDAVSRFAIASGVGVAREARHLQQLLGISTGWDAIQQFAPNSSYAHPGKGVPERLAALVRQNLRLAPGPIASVTRQVLEPLGILVLWEPMDPIVDAVSISTAETGGLILANPRGEHMASAAGRRIAWAHELCHILFDRNEMRRLKSLCAIVRAGELQDPGEKQHKIERRARAFAAYLLAPRDHAISTWRRSNGQQLDVRVRCFMDEFGLGYEATRNHLHNVDLLPLTEPLTGVPTETAHKWSEADPGPAATPPLASGVPPMRSGRMFDLTVEAVQRKCISEPAAAQYLGLSMSKWVELRAELRLGEQRWRSSSALQSD